MDYRLIAGSLALALAIPLYFNLRPNPIEPSRQVATVDAPFTNKQECASYRTAIEKDIKGLDFENKDVVLYNFLDEIWFSTSKNSCLYSVRSVWQFPGENKIETDFSVYDHLTNGMIYSVSDTESQTAYADFEDRKETLR